MTDSDASDTRQSPERVKALVAEPLLLDSHSEDSSWAPMFRTGQVVGGRYRILKFVARGGMGEVYAAYDQELHERLALKTVISGSADDLRAVRRLRAEVQLARRIGHPNVCRIYDFGTHAVDGGGTILNFLTMEFIEGESLSKRISRGDLALDEVLRLVRQLLLGLRAAHGAGIIHRDFKSENVMLRPQPNGETSAVIMDFGIARVLDVNAARLTTAGNSGLLGTPRYMAPEQLEGRALSAAADVYALGVVWFEMLTGQLPFPEAFIFERLTKPAPAPSSVNPQVPEEISQIVLRCLRRLPEERFANADPILQALEPFSVLEPKPSVPVSSRRIASRVLASTGIAVALGALCAFGVASRERPGPKPATLPANVASRIVSDLSSASPAPAYTTPPSTTAAPGAPTRRVGAPARLVTALLGTAAADLKHPGAHVLDASGSPAVGVPATLLSDAGSNTSPGESWGIRAQRQGRVRQLDPFNPFKEPRPNVPKIAE